MLGGADLTHLYLNSTLVLHGDTSEIVWHYQHMNDHWGLDHPLERLLVDTAVRPVSSFPVTFAVDGRQYGSTWVSVGTGRFLDLTPELRPSGEHPVRVSRWTKVCAGWTPRREPARSRAPVSTRACSASKGTEAAVPDGAGDLVTDRMPDTRITDILLEVDDATRFTEGSVESSTSARR